MFKLAPDGTETVRYSFCQLVGCADGRNPLGALIMDAAGNLYGTTFYGGGTDNGMVFELAPDGTETVLHSFCQQTCADGEFPNGALVMDAAGNLYGTTQRGGPFGPGAVFKLAPDGTETVLYGFCAQSDCADGAVPTAGLFMDGAGNLYGTMAGGGNPFPNSGGVVFKLTP